MEKAWVFKRWQWYVWLAFHIMYCKLKQWSQHYVNFKMIIFMYIFLYDKWSHNTVVWNNNYLFLLMFLYFKNLNSNQLVWSTCHWLGSLILLGCFGKSKKALLTCLVHHAPSCAFSLSPHSFSHVSPILRLFTASWLAFPNKSGSCQTS